MFEAWLLFDFSSVVSEQFDLEGASGSSTSHLMAGMGIGLDLALSTYGKQIHSAPRTAANGSISLFRGSRSENQDESPVFKGIETSH